MVICYSRLNMLLQSPNVFISRCFRNLLFIHLFRKQRRNMSVQLLSHIQFFATHGLQYSRPPCPLSTPRACKNSRPSSQWCHPTISSTVVPFSFCLQSLPASGSFPMSQFFTSGSQSIRASASASVVQWIFRTDFFRINWLYLLAVQGTLKSLLQHHSSKASILWCSAFFMVQLSQSYMITKKP